MMARQTMIPTVTPAIRMTSTVSSSSLRRSQPEFALLLLEQRPLLEAMIWSSEVDSFSKSSSTSTLKVVVDVVLVVVVVGGDVGVVDNLDIVLGDVVVVDDVIVVEVVEIMVVVTVVGVVAVTVVVIVVSSVVIDPVSNCATSLPLVTV